MRKGPLEAWASVLARVCTSLLWVGGAAMLTMAIVIVVSVVLRYFVGRPMLGANEIVQFGAVVLAMSALPYATFQKVHIRVDVLDDILGRWGRLFGDVLFMISSAIIMGFLCYRAVQKALDTLRWADVTNMLQIPMWPLYAFIAIGSCVCVLILLTHIVQACYESSKQVLEADATVATERDPI